MLLEPRRAEPSRAKQRLAEPRRTREAARQTVMSQMSCVYIYLLTRRAARWARKQDNEWRGTSGTEWNRSARCSQLQPSLRHLGPQQGHASRARDSTHNMTALSRLSMTLIGRCAITSYVREKSDNWFRGFGTMVHRWRDLRTPSPPHPVRDTVVY